MKNFNFKNESGNIVGMAENFLAAISNKQAKVQKPDCEQTFVRKTDFTARKGKQVSVRNKHHERIEKIVHVIGKGKVTIAEYIDNVLTKHFETYEEALVESYNMHLKSFNI